MVKHMMLLDLFPDRTLEIKMVNGIMSYVVKKIPKDKAWKKSVQVRIGKH